MFIEGVVLEYKKQFTNQQNSNKSYNREQY